MTINSADKKTLKVDHSTTENFINSLIETVPPEELDEILELRDYATVSNISDTVIVTEQRLNAKMLIRLYTVTQGNLDLAHRIIDWAKDKHFQERFLESAVKKAVNDYLVNGDNFDLD